MPTDKITLFDLDKLLDKLDVGSGIQINIINEVNINVNSGNEVHNIASYDYTFIDKLELNTGKKAEVKSAFEKFVGTLKTYKEGSEGLKSLIDSCAQYGPAASIALVEGIKLLQQLQ